MSTEASWLLPRQQTEYPAKDLVSEVTLHGRREATFLALATTVILAITVLLASGASRVVDVTALLASAGVELPVTLHVPFGAAPGALGLVAVMLACELYGRRRAATLVWAAGLASVALLGLAYLGDVLDGGDAVTPALALAAAALVAHVATLVVFGALRGALAGRHVALRAVITAMVAQGTAWAAFAALVRDPAATPLALGAAAYGLACTAVLALPLAVAARALRLYLRVARFERRLPPAVIVEDDEPAEEAPPRRRMPRASLQPFSSAELRFFREGDELATTDSAAGDDFCNRGAPTTH